MEHIKNLSECSWRFRNLAQKTWHNATVPGCVHTDLYQNRLIPDPFFALNEKKIQWIEKEDWEYRCEFEFKPGDYRAETFHLLFRGLDTYAEVSLNGHHLFNSDNMFVPVESDVTGILHDGTNEIVVILRSPFVKGFEKYKQLPYQLPANNDEHEYRVSPFTRKAPYMYGWDWGPRLLTSGIWKDVLLVGKQEASIEDVNIHTVSLSPKEAVLSVETLISAKRQSQYRIRIFIDNEESIDLTTNAGPEKNPQSFRVKIPNPKLWWPRGFGDANLYSFRIVLSHDDQILDEYLLDTGIRTVELIREKDDEGTSFRFRVNGKEIFIRGANMIPADYFVSSVGKKDYDELTDNAVAVNMNMIRAWGGGVYEDDYFYQLCDRKGLLVWQDFMFACGMYPSDNEYLENIGNEIRYQVQRLRNHPSLVLWCGNNEVLEGFHTWGWKEDLGEYAAEAYASYNKVFNELIPGILDKLDPSRPYWPTSPYSGDKEIISLKSGDYHYWDIVKELLPITVYKENIGRFMSEYGFKSYPSLKTIESYAGPGHNDIHSEVMESHQGWPGGAELVEKNLEWFYTLPGNFSHFIYLSQLLQADAIVGAIEAHRRAKPWCMGTLYWQLNDCWPSATWAGIDYYGRWKALQYRLKTAFSDILVSAEMKNGQLLVYLISDLPETMPVTVNLRILDFEGNELFFKNIPAGADPQKAILLFTENIQTLKLNVSMDKCFLDMKAFRKDHLLSHNSFYFVKPNELKLLPPGLEVKSEKVFDKVFLFLRSEKLAKNVYIDHAENHGFYSDNFFDLLPGEEKVIIFQSDRRNPDPGAFTCISLYEVLSRKKHR